MIYYAIVFFVLGLIAAFLGMTGMAAIASQIAWILLLIGVVLAVIHIISGRRAGPPAV